MDSRRQRRRCAWNWTSGLHGAAPRGYPCCTRKVGSDVWRAAPIFDFDGSFGFPSKGITIAQISENPLLFQLFCARQLSFLESSWDWTWYDPRALDGFEDRILEAYASCQSLPSGFAELIAHVFALQHEYVNKIASGE